MSNVPQVTVNGIDPEHMQSLGRQSTNDEVTPVTPEEYARAIQNFANLSNGEGRAFQQLAGYLSPSNKPSSTESTGPFVTLYTFDQNVSRTDQNSLGENTLPHTRTRSYSDNDATFFDSPEAFYSHTTSNQASQIIFLNGFPSPAWLKSIGAKYRVDPEFFRRHLDLLNIRQDSSSYSEPSLPSSLWHLIQLPIYTLGIKHDHSHSSSPVDLDASRMEARDALSAHHRRLRVPNVNESKLGEPIVRNYHILDESHFVIEQRVSICLQESGSRYVLLVWLDSTLRWNYSAGEPWCPRRSSHSRAAVELLPIVRYKRNLGLKSHRIKSETQTVAFGTPQSAALIHLDYARSPSQSAVRQDATYAIVELLRLAAASKCQLLNLLDAGLVGRKPNGTSTAAVSSLVYNSQILTYLLQQTHEVRQSMKNTASSHWPKASGVAAHKATRAWVALEADYECLRERTQMTSERYKEVIVILMNTMAIAESREAIVQAKKVSRLTSLAFIFVPLSFTTSFFGMNVKELSPQSTSIWYWVVVSAVVSGIAMAFLYFEKCIQVMNKVRMHLGRHKSSGDKQSDG